MLRTLIIDDEVHNRDTLRKMLARHCPQVEVAGEASGVSDGVHAIKEIRPGLVFLDVNLDDGTGFDLLHLVNPIDFRIIFISAFDKKMIRLMRSDNFDFLTKPFNPEELCATVKRSEKSNQEELGEKIKMLEKKLEHETERLI